MIGKKTQRVEETNFIADEITEQPTNEENNQKIASKPSKWVNKQRTLVIASRGVTQTNRHLMQDIISLLPHSKKEAKIEKNVAKTELNEICFNHSCKNGLYFEHRRRELVLWMFRAGEGPCAKFQVRNVHTLSEIKLMGNCLKYSRPLLSFDKSFDEFPHLKVLKELFVNTFNSPNQHPKTKPFYDHVMCFYNINNNIYFRNYQLINDLKERFNDNDDVDKLQLVEIGPRFSLTLMRIFEGAQGGKTLYVNPGYVPPRMLIQKNNDKFIKRKMKNDEEKRELDEQIRNIKDTKYQWLEK